MRRACPATRFATGRAVQDADAKLSGLQARRTGPARVTRRRPLSQLRGPGGGIEKPSLFLSTAVATPRDRRNARTVLGLSLATFLLSLPFAKVPLAPLPAFIPFYQASLAIIDLMTAVLLLGQFGILRSRAVLLLASAYLFTACMAFAHALSFPGLVTPTGLFGAGPQTTAWLYMAWHAGFPLLVIAYVLSRQSRSDMVPVAGFGRSVEVLSMAAVLAAAIACVLLATWGQFLLPQIMRGNGYAPAMGPVAGSVATLPLVAAAALWRRRSRSVLEMWLGVAMCTLAMDVSLSAVFNAGRFDLGFYAGRIYGLLATAFLLIVLLLESNMLHARLVETYQADRAKAAELRRLSILDPLTRIANRRAFEETIDQEWRRSVRNRLPLCLLMIDVDFFKRFNDRYGHVAGDQCLRAVAQVLAGNARRAGELAARYGGEEFAVILPQVRAEDACLLAERMCQDVRDLDIPHEASAAASCVTISVGVADALALAEARGSGERDRQVGEVRTWTMLVEQADAGLYAAKAAGRNRVALVPVDQVPSVPAAQVTSG
jgi:diguanylate cyclase (GGDEF)-like protein